MKIKIVLARFLTWVFSCITEITDHLSVSYVNVNVMKCVTFFADSVQSAETDNELSVIKYLEKKRIFLRSACVVKGVRAKEKQES